MKKQAFQLSLVLFLGAFWHSTSNAYSDLLSPKALALVGHKVTHHGPNCWNASLLATGLTPYVRHTTNLELHSFLESPLCQEVQKQDLKGGEIQVFYRPLPGLDIKNQIVHANIWLDNHYTFNKMTQYYTSGYEIVPHSEVMAEYQYFTDIFVFNVPQANGKNQQIRCPSKTVCENQLRYFRCSGSLESWAQKSAIAQNLQSILHRLRQIEKEMESNLFADTSFTALQISHWNAQLLRQQNDLQHLPRINTSDQMFREHLLSMIDSIFQQLSLRQPQHLYNLKT